MQNKIERILAFLHDRRMRGYNKNKTLHTNGPQLRCRVNKHRTVVFCKQYGILKECVKNELETACLSIIYLRKGTKKNRIFYTLGIR